MAGSNMKIIYLDDWPRGLGNFVAFNGLLTKEGHKTFMLHWARLNDPSLPKEEIKNGILCRDLSMYPKKDLINAIRIESPDAIVMLNCFPLMQRAAIKAARALKVPTVYIMHGLRIDETEKLIDSFRAGLKWRQRFAKIPKYLGVVKTYLKSGMMANRLFLLSSEPYKLLKRYGLDPAEAILGRQAAGEVECTRSLLYSEHDKELFRDYYGLSEESIRVVGNPKLDGVFGTGNLERMKENGMRFKGEVLKCDSKSDYLLYLEDGFVEGHIRGWSHNLQIEILKQMEGICVKRSMMLVVKLHPATNFDRLNNVFSKSTVTRIVKECDVDEVIFHSLCAVGHASTTLLNAIALHKPVLIAGWIKGVINFDFFTKYGGAINCESIDELDSALGNLKAVKEELSISYSKFASRLINYSDGLTKERIAREIIAIAAEYKALRSNAVMS